MSLQIASLRAWFWSSCLAGMIPGESRSSSSCSGFCRKNDHDHNGHDHHEDHEHESTVEATELNYTSVVLIVLPIIPGTR